jgi:hypothetical protein
MGQADGGAAGVATERTTAKRFGASRRSCALEAQASVAFEIVPAHFRIQVKQDRQSFRDRRVACGNALALSNF